MTSRERFQKSPTFKDACAMIASPLHEEALDVALLTFVDNTPNQHVEKQDQAQQLVGAKRFIATLQGLIRVNEPQNVQRKDTLTPTK